jgi:alkanesulfonate monooxygenase SsuD/methylene tetrahydromethanopterin reductase-like flavin-dependent oxidoreductase (luciferase family)
VLIDLAINPFEGDVPAMVELAQAAEQMGVAAVWVADHFSGSVVGRRWSRDPFVCLGAIAASTERIDLGVLVANMMNRHPAQLASAVNSLQSIAPRRVRLGLGSGAAPGSRFAIEHESIGRQLAPTEQRRAMLIDQLGALRSIWRGDGPSDVVDGSDAPKIVVGASAWPTIDIGLHHADGVNIRRTNQLDEHLRRLNDVRPPDFEVSVLESIDVTVTEDLTGVDRLIVGISHPHDSAQLIRLLSSQ